jgi:hypothetical protein
MSSHIQTALPYPQEERPQHSLDIRMDRTKGLSGCLEKEKSLAPAGIKPKLFSKRGTTNHQPQLHLYHFYFLLHVLALARNHQQAIKNM